MIGVFFVLTVLQLLQSLVALAGVIRFFRFVRRSRKNCSSFYTPEVSVILPCKGICPGLKDHLDAILHQDYPNYRVVFSVASRDDTALGFFEQYLKDNDSLSAGLLGVEIVVAEPSFIRGEKVNNSLCALRHVPESAKVLAFTDADALPGRDWLRCLVAPLEDTSLTVSTGFRWYLPGHRFISQLRATWDTSIATLLGEHRHNVAWGGSMAIRRSDFERLGVGTAWEKSLSDDYSLTRAVRNGGGTIRFEPRCLLASREEPRFGEFLRWTNRQIIITRVYAPKLWQLGLSSHFSYAATFLLGFALIVNALIGAPKAPEQVIRVASVLFLIQILGMVKGWIRLKVAEEQFPEAAETLARYGFCYWSLSPLVPWVMAYNFVTAGFTRRIEWAGVRYELRSPDQTVVLNRNSR